jgi:hypothetical protein
MAGSVSLRSLWPLRWVGYENMGAGLCGFPASTIGIPLVPNKLCSSCLFRDRFAAAAPGENLNAY